MAGGGNEVFGRLVLMNSSVEYNRHVHHHVVRWSCCGFVWELMLSRLYPDRNVYVPTCPGCGVTGTSANDMKRKDEGMKADYIIYFDGGSRGNIAQGYGSYLIVDLKHNTKSITQVKFGTGITCHEAEYKTLSEAAYGLCKMLLGAGQNTIDFDVLVMGDSMIVVQQVKGAWRCRANNIQKCHAEVMSLLRQFKSYQITWQPRAVSLALLGH